MIINFGWNLWGEQKKEDARRKLKQVDAIYMLFTCYLHVQQRFVFRLNSLSSILEAERR